MFISARPVASILTERQNTKEYPALAGKYHSLEQAAADEKCGLKFEPFGPEPEKQDKKAE